MSNDLRRMAPFIHTERTTKFMYFCLLIALIPPVTFAVFYYGLRALILIGFCSFLASLCQSFKDYSAPVHGIVFALMLPADASVFTAAIGVLASELMLKKMFGGPGSNIVYPAAFGRMLLEIVFPQDMIVASEPGSNWFNLATLVRIGGESKHPLANIQYTTSEIIAGRFPTFMGMGCFVLIIVGMGFIWQAHATKLAAPITYLVSVFLIKLLVNYDAPVIDTVTFVMTSGVAFVAVYILTDPTNTAQFGYASLVEGVVGGASTALLSLRVSGIMLILIPVLLLGLMDGSIRFYVGLLEKKRLEEETR